MLLFFRNISHWLQSNIYSKSMSLHWSALSLVGSIGGLKKKEEGYVSGRICLGIALKRGGIWARPGNWGNPEETSPPGSQPSYQSLGMPGGRVWCDPEWILQPWGGHHGVLLSVSSAVNKNLGRGWCWQEGFEFLGHGHFAMKLKG